MNNETLEVEDLAEKITQAQLEEVKAHFDTKLSATKTEVISEVAQMIKDAKDEIIQSRILACSSETSPILHGYDNGMR